jgi:hypothetical protein
MTGFAPNLPSKSFAAKATEWFFSLRRYGHIYMNLPRGRLLIECGFRRVYSDFKVETIA